MTGFLFEHIDLLACMDGMNGKAIGRELRDASVLVRDGVIVGVGGHDDVARNITGNVETINLSGHVVIPGMVNTHHHLFQNLTRVIPAAQNESLFGWLKTLYPIWRNLAPRDFHIAASAGLAELALSGCTTASDHQYIFPNGSALADSIEAAAGIGMRFTATRGSMSIGETKGGLPPDDLTEDEDDILRDCLRVIDAFHDPAPHAMCRIALAPCSPFTVSRDLMRETAIMARDKGVRLHTHLAENTEDIDYALANYAMRPGDYVGELGWTGEDVWHAHCVQLNEAEIGLFARTGTGIAHCPCSNMRLGSGIAPLRRMLDAGVRIGLGVDGSASSDSGNLLAEARTAMLLQRVANGGNAAGMTAREALWLATRGGAEVLGREDAIGQIAEGFAADLAVFDRRVIDFTGTASDPLAALLFCGPVKPRHVMVAGKFIVRDGELMGMDMDRLLSRHETAARELMERS